MGDEIFKGIESVDLEGDKVDDSLFKGTKLTMVNIWGTFCGPCVSSMPGFQTISEEYAEKGLRVVGIVCDVIDENDTETIEDAKIIYSYTGAKYTTVIPSPSINYAILDSVVSVPVTIFLDEYGCQVGQRYVGARSLEDWKAIIDSILAEM